MHQAKQISSVFVFPAELQTEVGLHDIGRDRS